MQKMNKHGLPILGTSSQQKKEKDRKLCRAKGCIYDAEMRGYCLEHYTELTREFEDQL